MTETYYLMPESEYDKLNGLRGGLINEYHLSARRGAWCQKHKKAPSAQSQMVMNRGIAVHACLLEPERFKEHAIEPCKLKGDDHFKIGPTAAVTYEKAQEHFGKDAIILADGWGSMCKFMAEWVLNKHPVAREIFAVPGVNELAVRWDDDDLGIAGKIRLDRVREDGIILDVKTTSASEVERFEKIAADKGYHRKFAWQSHGATKAGLSEPDAGVICVMLIMEPPYDVVVLHDSPGLIQQGWAECVRAAKRYKRFNETGEAPGICSSYMPMSIPRWMQADINTPIPLGGTKS